MECSTELRQHLSTLKDNIKQFMELHSNPYDTSKFNEVAKKLEHLATLLGAVSDTGTAPSAPSETNGTTSPENDKLLYEDEAKAKHGQAFVDAVREMGKRLGLDPSHIMATMKAECNFNHKAVNPHTSATGLIQFMPATARGLGTTVGALKSMSAMKQLEYVESYYKSHGRLVKLISEPAESYLLVFYPYAVGKPDDYILGSQVSDERARKIASQNGIYDLNKDGYITKGEIMQYMRENKYKDAYARLDDTVSSGGNSNTYVVQSGDKLEALAAKFGVTVEALKEANRDQLKRWGDVEGFNAGATISIPSGSSGSSEPSAPSDTDGTTSPAPSDTDGTTSPAPSDTDGTTNPAPSETDGTTSPENDKLLYEDEAKAKHGQAFVDAVREMGKRLGLDPSHIMATMKAECNFNHKAVNPHTSATGLIQFMPATARGLGTTVGALKSMSAMKQLEYVESYYKSHGRLVKLISEPAESYLLVFYPYAVGKSDDYILGSQVSDEHARKITSQNGIYDLNKDGYITKGEIMQYMRENKYKDAYARLDDTVSSGGNSNTYVVQSGDKLEALAAKFGVTVEALKEANRDQLKRWGDVEGFNAGATISIPSS